jgi:hypothetical protein
MTSFVGILFLGLLSLAAGITTNVCNMNWYYCPRDPGCTTYTMSVHTVNVDADAHKYAVYAENLTATDIMSIEVQGITTLKSIPVAGSYRIYNLAGHNMAAGVLSDVMKLSGNAFTLNIKFTLDAGAFGAGKFLEWGLDVFQQQSGSDEAMCIEFADKEYLAHEESVPSPPFVDLCIDNGDGTFTNKTVPVPTHVIPAPSCQSCNDTGLDVVFVLDGSGSISSSSWSEIKSFSEQIGLGLPAAKHLVAYSIIQFSQTAVVEMPLAINTATFLHVVTTMRQMRERTNTEAGMVLAEKELNAGTRPKAHKVVIVITDGNWNEGGSPIPTATAIKSKGAKIFTIAVGEARQSNVKALASLPLSSYYYPVASESNLKEIIQKLLHNICP